MTREELITILDLQTNYSLVYLEVLSLPELQKLYAEKVGQSE